MRRQLAVVLLGAGMLAIGAWPALAGTSGGNGAQKADLSPQPGSVTDQCKPGSSAGNGWIMLNKTGNPAVDSAVYQGEIHLTGGTPNTTYTVAIAQNNGSDSCMTVGMMTTNIAGIGNAHIPVPKKQMLTSGSYYIVLSQGSTEAFASGPVSVT